MKAFWSRDKKRILYKILILAIIFFSLIKFLKFDFPITILEAKEGYTAFSLVKTFKDTNGDFPGLFFRTEDQLIPSASVYLRIIPVLIFGLNFFSVRIITVLLSLLLLTVIYLTAHYFFKDRLKAIFSVLLFTISPFFIYESIFKLDVILGVILVLTAFNFYLKQKIKYLILCLVPAFFAGFIPFLMVLFFNVIFFVGKKSWLNLGKLAMAFLIIGVLIFILNPSLSRDLISITVLKQASPENYGYLIDRRIAHGFTEKSPLITERFNFNRIAFNKVIYSFNELSKQIIGIFDFERLASPNQSYDVIKSVWTQGDNMIKFRFWEIPLIVISLIYFLTRKKQKYIVYATSLFLSLVIFGKSALFYALPLIILAEASLIFDLPDILKRSYLVKGIYTIGSILLILSTISFFDIYFFHQDYWVKENDLRQFQIWSELKEKDIGQNKLFLTDRLGEPIFYYLFYEKVAPENFFNNRQEGGISSNGVKRISAVGNVYFSSFKYYESDRKPKQIWIGMAGEFAGDSLNYQGVTEVTDGKVYKKITDVKQNNQFIGSEIWFVKTKFDE